MSALADEIRQAVREALRDELPRALREGLGIGSAAAANNDGEEALDLEECSRLSGYAVGTLRKAIKKGKLAAKKGAKEWRVRRADLLAWEGRPQKMPSVVDLRAKAAKMIGAGQ